MERALFIAAFLAFAIGIAHSVLGERLILIRLFRSTKIPHLFGGPEFTIQTLRFAWHLTTVAWWGFAVILLLLATHSLSEHNVAIIIAITFLSSSVITAIISRGKHFAWPIFLIIGAVSAWVVT